MIFIVLEKKILVKIYMFTTWKKKNSLHTPVFGACARKRDFVWYTYTPSAEWDSRMVAQPELSSTFIYSWQAHRPFFFFSSFSSLFYYLPSFSFIRSFVLAYNDIDQFAIYDHFFFYSLYLFPFNSLAFSILTSIIYFYVYVNTHCTYT